MLPWEVSVVACPAKVWVVLWLSVLKSSNFLSSLIMKSSILLYWADIEFLRVGDCALAASMLKCWMLEGTEGEPIEVGVVGRLVVGFMSWLGFGETGMFAGGLGLKMGFGNFGASKRAWVLKRLARESLEVGFWVGLGSRLRSGFCSDSSVSGLGSSSISNTGVGTWLSSDSRRAMTDDSTEGVDSSSVDSSLTVTSSSEGAETSSP